MPITKSRIVELTKLITPEERASIQERFTKSLADLEQAGEQAILDMGGNPKNKRWGHVPYALLFEMADVVRDAKALGLTVTVKPPDPKRTPGPKPMEPDEMMNLAWRLLQSSTSQVNFAALEGVSRYSVQAAKQWCEEHPIIFRQFQAKRGLQ